MAGGIADPTPAMDRRVHRLASRVSAVLASLATLCLVHFFRHASASASCFPASRSLTLTLSLAPFPRVSCDAASRRVLPPDRRLAKLRSSHRWRRRSVALNSSAFPTLRGLRLLNGSSRVLCIAAGAGNAVDALHTLGVSEVTGVDLVDFPPLVRRADPHHLPFPDGAFDLVFSDDPAGFSGALFPSRLAIEAERTVRLGGAIALAVDSQLDPAAVAALFKRSRIVDMRDVILDGSQDPTERLVQSTNCFWRRGACFFSTIAAIDLEGNTAQQGETVMTLSVHAVTSADASKGYAGIVLSTIREFISAACISVPGTGLACVFANACVRAISTAYHYAELRGVPIQATLLILQSDQLPLLQTASFAPEVENLRNILTQTRHDLAHVFYEANAGAVHVKL